MRYKTQTINIGNVDKIFSQLRGSIGDKQPQYLVIDRKRTINYKLYRGKGRPRKSDYNHDSDYDYLMDFADQNGFIFADKTLKNGLIGYAKD